MTLLQSLVLGIVQGLTEFLPISSSGHLIIVRQLLGMTQENSITFDLTLHLATLAAVLIYFWKDIWNLVKTFFRIILRKEVEQKERVFLYAIILGTIPAVILGMLFKDTIENTFRNTHLVAWALIVGSALMYIAERIWKKKTEKEGTKPLTIINGFIVGCYQVLALVPGMSRSGSTISGGLLTGLDRETAVRFSFILSFPLILGSGILALKQAGLAGISSSASIFAVGFFAAFITGLAAIYFLVKYLKNHTFSVFMWYRVILAILILIFL